MSEYVLTSNDEVQVIYGVLDADTDHDAGMTVLRAVTEDGTLAERIFFFKALSEASAINTDIRLSELLVGQGWFELAPTEPLPGGQPGGEHQDGDALSRRFALKRRDGNWAVVTRYVYLSIPLGEPDDSERRVIEVANYFAVCKDLHDIDGTSFWDYETYTGLPYEPTQHMVRREAFLFFSGDITWDGQEFDDDHRGGLLR